MFAGMMARPRATSARTNSGVIASGMFAPNAISACVARDVAGKPNVEVELKNFEFELRFVSRFRILAFLRFAPHILANRYEFHLRRDDAFPRVIELSDRIRHARRTLRTPKAAAPLNVGR